jgi:hypothetical protein
MQKNSNNVVKLPLQLAGLIQGEEQGLMDEGYLLPPPLGNAEEQGTSSSKVATKNRHPPTQVVMASHAKFLRELQSYTRAVSMRLGFD